MYISSYLPKVKSRVGIAYSTTMQSFLDMETNILQLTPTSYRKVLRIF